MRFAALSFGLFSMVGLRICGNDDPPPPPIAAAPVVTAQVAPAPPAVPVVEANALVAGGAPVIAAKRGGTAVRAGNYVVEVLPKADGHIDAYVNDMQSEAPPPDQVSLTVTMQAHPVVLAWDPQKFCYEGQLDVPVVPGPVDVVLVESGQPFMAHADFAPIVSVNVALEPPHVRVEGRVPGAQGEVALRGPSGAVVVGAPSAGIMVAPPTAGLVVDGPVVGVAVRGPSAAVELRGPGVIVEPPRVRAGVEVRVEGPPPPPPMGISIGGGITFGGPGPVFVEGRGGDDDGDEDRGPHGHHGDHGEHGRGHHYGHD